MANRRHLTINRFERGLDVRKGASVADANRMRVLHNAHVTTGRDIATRPGLVKVADLSYGSVGLIAGRGKLFTVHSRGDVVHDSSLVESLKVDDVQGNPGVASVHMGFVINGQLYMSILHGNGVTRHHLMDGSSDGTIIQDENCPHGKRILPMASKVWSPMDEQSELGYVRFSATAAPRDWSSSQDAGFLPCGQRHQGDPKVVTLGEFRGKLVVFFQDGMQLWSVDPDPAQHVHQQTMPGLGTRWPGSIATLTGNLYFLAEAGFRSVSMSEVTSNMAEIDVGSPIDPLVVPTLDSTANPMAAYYPKAGQYWCMDGEMAWVFSLSQTAKISAWSQYQFPFAPEAVATLGGDLYLRAGNAVYRVDPKAQDDDGQDIEWAVELPYLDAKTPGVDKQFFAMDVVMEGQGNLAFRWDARREERITQRVELSGDSRPDEPIPLELMAQAISPVFTGVGPARIQALTFYYNQLGVV